MEDLYSVPVKGRRGADTRRETGSDGGEREERMVDIYESVDAPLSTAPGQTHGPTGRSLETRETQTAPANLQNQNRLQAAAWSLAVVCLLLLAGLVGLTGHHFTVTGQNDELQSTLDKVKEELNTLLKEQDALRKNLTGNICTCWPNTSCSCYYFSQSADGKTWEESRDDCEERGYHLMIVNSQAEQEFFKHRDGFWLGLTDAGEEGTWKWVDGTPVNTTYWASPQPDNNGQAPNTEEDCAVISAGGWNDVSCLDHHFWICERDTDI